MPGPWHGKHRESSGLERQRLRGVRPICAGSNLGKAEEGRRICSVDVHILECRGAASLLLCFTANHR